MIPCNARHISSTKNLGIFAFLPLFCIEIVVLSLFFFNFVNYPYVFKMKHLFAPIPAHPQIVHSCQVYLTAHRLSPRMWGSNQASLN
jgi:hypothetical protein